MISRSTGYKINKNKGELILHHINIDQRVFLSVIHYVVTYVLEKVTGRAKLESIFGLMAHLASNALFPAVGNMSFGSSHRLKIYARAPWSGASAPVYSAVSIMKISSEFVSSSTYPDTQPCRWNGLPLCP